MMRASREAQTPVPQYLNREEHHMLYTYSVTPLFEDHFEERLADIIDQYRRGITTCPLFIVYLEPEGNPVWKKAPAQAALYRRYKERLDAVGVPSGILVQSSFGHGTTAVSPPKFPFMEPLDGSRLTAYCPIGEGLLDHLCSELRVIAAEHPSAIMLDDDFRLLMRPGSCCACPNHMAELNRRCKTSFTKESLYEYLKGRGEGDPIARAFVTLQRDTMVHTATVLRAAVDEVDPDIQGINCTSGDECDSVIYTAPIWCGSGKPTIVRAPNGTYAPVSVKGFSDTMRRAAVSAARLYDNGIDHVLAECDTVPFNRYAKNATYLHAHFLSSILDGLRGAKHWITRTVSYEPESGASFRSILAKHRGLYERLAELVRGIKFVGANSVFTEQKWYDLTAKNPWSYHKNTWASSVFERLGIPFYFSNKSYGAAFLEDSIGRLLPDEEIERMFDEGWVFMTAEVASDLYGRGYGDRIGVRVGDMLTERCNYEKYGEDAFISQKQKGIRVLTPEAEGAHAISVNVKKENGRLVDVSPAVVRYDRNDGAGTVVFCGTPDAIHCYTEGFAFLNQTRKRQLTELLKEAGALPVYLPSDNELCLRAGELSDGRLLCMIINLSYDPEWELTLYLEKEPSRIVMLDENGEERALEFSRVGERLYTLSTACMPMYPVVLIVS